ncbi:hypothetical protein Taro_022330, partial [Colocasia esculenta]|nr:hypothetical protein [Colocasia esculenta]
PLVGTLEFRSIAEPIARIQPVIFRTSGSSLFLGRCKGIDDDGEDTQQQQDEDDDAASVDQQRRQPGPRWRAHGRRRERQSEAVAI